MRKLRNYIILCLLSIGLMFSAPVWAGANFSTSTGYLDLGNRAQFVNSFNWTFNAGTSTPNVASSSVSLYACNTTTPDASYTGCATSSAYYSPLNSLATTTATSSSLASLAGYRYLHYAIGLYSSSTDPNIVASLTAVGASYDFFQTSGWLISSPFNSQAPDNLFAALNWAASTSAGTTLRFQVRTATDLAGAPNWSNSSQTSGWCGPNDCSALRGDLDFAASSSSFFAPGTGTTSQRDGLSDQWMQYAVWFETTDTSVAPLLNSITLQYAQNAPPQFQSVVASQDNFGNVSVTYAVRDPDTASSTPPANAGQPFIDLQYCSTTTDQAINCPDKGASPYWLAASTSLVTGAGTTSINLDGMTWVSGTLAWQPQNEALTFDNQTLKLRVRGNDHEFANSLGYGTTTIANFDNQRPAPVSINVNAGNGQTANVTLLATDQTPASSFQMRLALASSSFANFTDDTGWLPYNSTTSLPISGAPSSLTVFVQYRDAKNNRSNVTPFLNNVSMVMTPNQLTSFMISDLSNYKDPTNEIYALEFSWSKPGTLLDNGNMKSSYDLYIDQARNGLFANKLKSVNNANHWGETTNTEATSSYTELRSKGEDLVVNMKKDYRYYLVVLVDSLGNVSMPSEILRANPNGVTEPDEGGGGTTVVTLPKITNATTSLPGSNYIDLAWNTDILADSQVVYTTEAGCKFNTELARIVGNAYYVASSSGLTPGHQLRIDNLQPSTTYYYQLRSVNANGAGLLPVLCNSETPLATQLSFTTMVGPSIIHASVATTSVGNTTADIRWDTTPFITENNYVYYSTSTIVLDASPQNQAPNIGVSFRASAHGVTLFGLTPGTPYHFYVRSDNAEDRNTINGSNTYFSFTTTQDITPPTIKGVIVSVGDVKATVNFTTSENATSTVILTDPTTHLEVARGDNSLPDVYHSIPFTNLASSTSYNYAIIATDRNGNTSNASGTLGSFTTLATPDTTPPVISTSSADFLTVSAYQATINWKTNKLATGYLDYLVGTTTGFDSSAIIRSSGLNLNHTINLAGLDQNQTYYFRLRAVDNAGNFSASPATSTGQFYQFTTVAGPAISSTTASTTETSATITWTTSEPANGYVIYGTPDLTISTEKGSASLTLDHAINITSLSPATTYQYKLRSTNASAGVTIYPDSSTLNFTTGLSAFTISNVATSAVTDRSAVITWNTSRQTQTKLYYGTTSGQLTQLKNDNSLATNPTVVLTDLASSTAYYFQIVNTDDLNRTATSSEYSFITTAKLYDQSVIDQLRAELAIRSGLTNDQVASLQAELATAKAQGGGGTIIIDKTDKVPPVLSNIQVNSVTATSSRITWETNEPASGFIKYGDSDKYGNYFGFSDLFTKHFFDLKNLTPATKYYYLVQSGDASGNIGSSARLDFTTAAGSPADLTMPEASASSSEALTPGLIEAAASRMIELLKGFANSVSVGTFENTLFNQYDALDKLAKMVPGPVLTGEPAVETTPTTATIDWTTNKAANSLVAYTPAVLYRANSKQDKYLQSVGDSKNMLTKHQVKIIGLSPNSSYHYQLSSKSTVGPETVSGDFVFNTKPEALEIVSYTTDILSPDKAIFKWLSSAITDSEIQVTPYHGVNLAVEEVKTISDRSLVTSHELSYGEFNAGMIYQVVLSGKNDKGTKIEKVIPSFSTTKDDLPPEITDIQTESALSQGKNVKVQTIITWLTNEPTISQIKYAKGVFEDEKNLNEETPLETVYSRKHTLVITKFSIGEVYSFRVLATDSGGNQSLSKPHIVLTPKQKEGVFELIIRTFESTFGWLGRMK